MDNFIRRGGYGPNTCTLCHRAAETVEHLFSTCSVMIQLWSFAMDQWGFPLNWGLSSISAILQQWHKNHRASFSFPLYFLWVIWKLCNRILFGEYNFAFCSASQFIVNILSCASMEKTKTIHRVKIRHTPTVEPGINAFFDGAEQLSRCGAGAYIFISHTEHYEHALGCGEGSNTRA